MQLIVQGKQIEIGDALRMYVQEKLDEINAKYFNHATDATVTFSREGHGHGLIRAHISIRIGKNIMVMADAIESEAYLSFDVAHAKVAKQMRRYKKRLRTHHDSMERAEQAIQQALDYTLSQEEPDEADEMTSGDDPVVIAEMVTNIQTMSVSDAVMRLDLANQTALLFRNAKNNELNLVYRRPDGNIGWVDPANSMVSGAASPRVSRQAAE